MSTRASIKIQQGGRAIYLYHHFDGYPEYVGVALKNFTRRLKGEEWHFETLATLIAKDIKILDDFYEVAYGIHPDVDYVYVIDCDKRTLRCFRHHLRE